VSSVPDPPKLLDRVRDRIRRLGYAKRTEQSYVHWIKRLILFHGKRHPAEMGKVNIEAFLTNLTVERNVSASTQSLALSAILLPRPQGTSNTLASSFPRGREPRINKALDTRLRGYDGFFRGAPHFPMLIAFAAIAC
jgi:hypothetical protein